MAADFFRNLGLTITSGTVEPDSAFENFAKPGVITIEPGQLQTTSTYVVDGETHLSYTPGGQIFGAKVVIAYCSALAVAHELGHCYGLKHSKIQGNLMYPLLEHTGWQLTEDQIMWITQP